MFVSTYFPYDPPTMVQGVYKRMRMFMDAIKDTASIDMLIYVPPETNISEAYVNRLKMSLLKYWDARVNLFLCPARQPEYKNKLSKYFFNYLGGAFSFFRQSIFFGTSGPLQLQAFDSCLKLKPDAIFVHRLGSMGPLLKTRNTSCPVYFDLDDIEHIASKRNISFMRKWYEKAISWSHIPSLLRGELRAIRLSKTTFVCSKSDSDYMKKHWHLSQIETVPNAVEIPACQKLSSEPTMLFLGSYKFKPNINAVNFLLNEVWPIVHKKMPSANLIIAGKYSETLAKYGKVDNGVTFAGFVNDIGELYNKTKVVCAPILSGAGTRIKIIEAAAYGKPIVSTSLGAEGLDMNDGHDLLLRDDAESFADACLELFRDHALAERLGMNARNRAVQSYDRKNIIKQIQGHIEEKSID